MGGANGLHPLLDADADPGTHQGLGEGLIGQRHDQGIHPHRARHQGRAHELPALVVQQPASVRPGLRGPQGERGTAVEIFLAVRPAGNVDVAEHPAIHPRRQEILPAQRPVAAAGHAQVAVENAQDRRGVRSRAEGVHGVGARMPRGEGPPGQPQFFPRQLELHIAPVVDPRGGGLFLPQQVEGRAVGPGARVEHPVQFREDLGIVVARHRRDGDPGLQEAQDAVSQGAPGFQELVVGIDDVPRQHQQVGAVPMGAVQHERPGTAVGEAWPRHGRQMGNPAEMDVRGAKNLHGHLFA